MRKLDTYFYERVKIVFLRKLFTSHKNHMFQEMGHSLNIFGVTETAYPDT